ncbi:MAG: undecaprenyldiphospho-muramoylpentapeptide beta-N-acetylglucosaminyltransferase [Pseudomonadota bacterium]
MTAQAYSVPSGQFVIAAGGTGGHMAPAYSTAQEMLNRGYEVLLVSDVRGQNFPGKPEGAELALLDAQQPGKGLFSLVSTVRNVRRAQHQAKGLLSRSPTSAVIGFGGYPALPTMLAAKSIGIPFMLHEQNAVLGRTNRLAAGKANALAVSFKTTHKLAQNWRMKTALTGTPVRPDIMRYAQEDYPAFSRDSVMRILVLGGSQGARILSDVVPEALAVVPPALRARIQITQHCREEDIDRVRQIYKELKVAAEVTSFVEDVGEKLRWTHLVIARAGASTIAELTAMGRPAIFVPFAAAMDDHQTANAAVMTHAGGAISMPEASFNARGLAKHLQRLSLSATDLADMAKVTKQLGYPKAAKQLVDMCEFIAAGRTRSAA